MADDNKTNIPSEDDIKKLQEQLRLIVDTAEAEAKAKEILKAKLGLQYEYLTAVEIEYAKAQEVTTAANQQIAALEAAIAIEVARTDNLLKGDEAEKQRAKLQKDYNINGKATLKQLEVQLKAMAGIVQTEKDILADNKTQKETAENTGQILKTQLETSWGLKDTAGTMSDIFIDTLGDQKSIAAAFEAVGKQMKKIITMKNVAKKISRDITALGKSGLKAMFGMDGLLQRWQQMGQELTQATGATQEYGIEAKKMVGVLRAQNFTMKETSDIYETLFTQSQAFSDITAKGREGLVVQAANLKRLGVTADTFAASIDGLNKVYGSSPKKIMKTTAELSNFGRALGIGPNKMLVAFNNNLNLMAYYGEKKAVEMLKKLAVTAKKTGIEMSKLVSIAEQFDTFEGAAESAGQLNMLLGGPFLNSMELMNASEEERIELIRRSMQMSGKQFDQMGKFEKKAIAAAMKVDVDIAQKLFSDKNISTIEEATAAIERQAAGLGALGDQAEKATTPAQMQAAANEKMLDLMEKMGPAINELNKILAKFSGFMSTIAPIIGLVMMAIQGLTLATALYAQKTIWASLVTKMAWLTNPVTWIILGILAALYVLYAYWDTISSMFVDMSEAIGDGISAVGEGIMDTFAAIGDAIGSVYQSIMGVFEAIGSFIINFANLIVSTIVHIIFAIPLAIAAVIDFVTGKAAALASLIPGVDIEGTNWVGAVQGVKERMMPNFKEGVDDREGGGNAIVGEGGPEMRVVPPGSNIITNENLSTISNLVSVFMGAIGGDQQPAPAGARPEKQTINVTLKIDNDVLAKHTAEVATDVMNTMLEFG